MNRILCVFLVLGAIVTGAAADIGIGKGEAFRGDYYIARSGTITNSGSMSGNIFINGGIQVEVLNHGDMSARFVLSDGAELVHRISSVSELVRLDVSGGLYIPTIGRGFSGTVSASDLFSFGTTIAVENTMLEVNAMMSELADLAGILDMTICGSLRINITDYDGGPLSLPDFGGQVSVSGGHFGDPMFRYAISGGTARLVRETNYAAILGKTDARALLLDRLRAIDPENGIIEKFDSANTLPELDEMMGKSMFFNPGVLNGGIIKMMARPDFYDIPKLGPYANARAVLDKGNLGTDFGLGFSGDNFSVSLGLYSGSVTENGDYKYGSADVHGASAGARCGQFGFGAKMFSADWDGIAIADGPNIKTSAKSRLFYSFLDFSPDFSNIRPIVRMNYVKSEIADFSDDRFFLSYGAMFRYSEKIMGMENKYGVYAAHGLDTDFGISIDSHFIEDNIDFLVKASPRNLSVEIRAGF